MILFYNKDLENSFAVADNVWDGICLPTYISERGRAGNITLTLQMGMGKTVERVLLISLIQTKPNK